MGRLSAGLLCIAFGHAAWASGTVCVDNATDLALALDDAQGSATTVQIVRGTYDVTLSVWDEHHSPRAKLHDGSSILGGYGANCTSRNIDVNNTILKTDDYAAVIALGDATFEGLTFQIKDGFNVFTNGIASGSEVLFRRNSISGNISGDGVIPLYVEWDSTNAGTVRLVDNLVEGNSAKNNNNADYGAVSVVIVKGAPKVELVNNTIVGNLAGYNGFALLTTTAVPFYAYNNIFYGNDQLDVFVQTGNSSILVDNDIGTFFIPAPTTPAVGTLRGDPKLDSNFKPIESPASPVINAGTDDVVGGLPSTDLPGHDREIGSEPDLGAYESSVSDSLIQAVTTTADSGPGSLRAAIEGANANGSSGAIITFQIGSSCGPQVIHLATPLPSTTAETHILGFTQTGASANSLQYGDNSVYCVILDGATNQIADGFAVQNNAPNAAALSVNGIAFSGFTHSALNLRGGVGHFINGVRTGGTVNSGTANAFTLADVSYGIILGPGVHGATIGVQNDESSRNVIGGALNDGIHIDESSGATVAAHDNQIVNNYIGVSYAGNTAGNNGNTDDGISVGGDSNTIQYNTFGFNGTDAVHVLSADAHDNSINNNLIGTDDEGSTIPNNDGMLVDTGAHDNDLSNNIIDNNTGNGVTMLDASIHNSLLGSEFSSNRGLAIDLGGDGVSANDNDSQEVGQPNRKQNFPVISSAIGEGTKGTVSGLVTSTFGTYTIDVYASTSCDASGYGEGTELVGSGTASVSLTANGQGPGSFKIDVLGFFFAGFTHMTATATDSSGDTSEFSQCFDYTDDQIFGNGFEPSGLL